MSNPEFAIFLYNNLTPYLVIFPFVILVYLVSLRKYFNSIIDPFFLCIVTSALAFIPVLYLKYFNLIKDNIFYYCIFAELSFWLGFVISYKKSEFAPNNTTNIPDKLYFNLFLFFAAIVVFFQLLIYAMFGIPLFSKNRLETFSSGGGFAMVSKIVGILKFFCVIYSFYIYKTRSFIAILFILFYVVTLFLGGSKSFILGLFTAYFVYLNFYKEQKVYLPKYLYLLVFLTPFLVLLVKPESDMDAAIEALLFRIAAYGDIYWYSFPEDDIQHILIKSPLLNLFSQVLGPLRLIDYKEHGVALGTLLFWRVDGDSVFGITGGPNARPVVLGYAYFRYWGVVFCYICGSFMAIFMSHLKKYFSKNILTISLIGYIYINSTTIAIDPVLSLMFIIPLTLCVFFTKYIMYLLSCGSVKMTCRELSCDFKNKCSVQTHALNFAVISIISIVLFFI